MEPASFLISIDPGFNHLAILILYFKIHSSNKTVTFKIFHSSVNDIGEPTDNVVDLSIAVDECLKKCKVYDLPAEKTMCLMEQGFLSYFHTPQNAYCFVNKVRLHYLEATLYNILTRAHKISTFFLPALQVRNYFNHGTGKHYENKKESIKLTKKIFGECSGSTEARDDLKSKLLPSDSMEDNHLCDAFNQFVFFLKNNLKLEHYSLVCE